MDVAAGDSTAMAQSLRLPPMSHYAKATLTIVAVLVALAAAWAVRNILLLVLVAAVLAIGLDPAVQRLQRWKIPRGWSVAIIFLATLLFLAAFFAVVVPPLVREVRELASNIPDYINRLKNSSGTFGDLQQKYNLSERLKSATDNLPKAASASFGTVLGFTKSIASLIFNTLTVAILTIYFLAALPRGRRTAAQLVSREGGPDEAKILEESLQKIGGYVSGNIAISVIAGVLSFVAMAIIGVPFAAALAMWVAIADLIPTVGATLGAVPAVIVAFFSSVGDGIATIAFFIVYQQFENYLIAPRVMKKAIDLTPAAVVISVLIGGSLAGFAGALLALPIAAAIKVVVREVVMKDRAGTARSTAKA